MTTRLDFSIGPVQGFVSQSRRTRDLWGSSYLLSFLSAHAMRGAVEAGGRLLLPDAGVVEQDRLYQWVSGHREGDPPRIGSLPNHFAVEVEGDAAEAARAGKRSLQVAWNRVCQAVWSRFIEPACSHGNGTEGIWTRQVDSFWDVMWTASGADETHGLLARRKHWRSHFPPDEPGDKCTVMHDWQELSGFVRARSGTRQDAFWSAIREAGRVGLLDLRENERLCAIALVKRLFPKDAIEALGWEVDASRWPSTVYVGAVPWIRRVGRAVPAQAAAYAEAVGQSAAESAFPMRRPPFDLDLPDAGNFPKLDGNYLHRDFVMRAERCPLREVANVETRKDLASRLQSIYDVHDDRGFRLGPPPSFYALLLADGDRLGRLASILEGPALGKALGAFLGEALGIVGAHDGVTVYAGGDDVLAMLPIPRALDCAQALSDAYRNAFNGTTVKDEATLSAAVVFAQIRLPLSQVLGEAHRLLDDIAKERNGRDSLAVAVLKPGGPYCEWATSWTRRGPDGEAPAVGLLNTLANRLSSDTEMPGLSSALVYRIREMFTRLCGWNRWEPGKWGDLPEDIDVRAFVHAEIAHSLEVRTNGGAQAHARELAADVWHLLLPAPSPKRRDTGVPVDGGGGGPSSARAGVDALLLARFLADPDEQESGQ